MSDDRYIVAAHGLKWAVDRDASDDKDAKPPAAVTQTAARRAA